MSARTRKVESQLKEIVGEEVAALSDPRIRGLVTVTAIRVSPDLAHGTVFYTVLAGTDAEEAREGLDSAAGRIQAAVAAADAHEAHAEAALRTGPDAGSGHQDRDCS